MNRVKKFLDEVYRLVEENEKEKTIDFIFNEVDKMLCSDDDYNTDDVSEMLREIDISRLNLSSMLAILTITLPVKHYTYRQKFLMDVEIFLCINPKKESLLKGLR